MLQRGKLNNGELLDYAFGLVVEKYRGLDTVDHAGGDAGYRSDMTRFPGQHFSAAVLCNSAISDSRAARIEVKVKFSSAKNNCVAAVIGKAGTQMSGMD